MASEDFSNSTVVQMNELDKAQKRSAYGSFGDGDTNTPSSSNMQTDQTTHQKSELLYGIKDDPPWSLTFLLGIQNFLTMFGGSITVPFILTPLMCIPGTHFIRGVIFSSIIFTSGLLTFFQTTFGARLPIVQGPSFSYLIPTMALIRTTFPPCDSLNFSNLTHSEQEVVYLSRIREIQGSIAVACLVQVFIGFTGLAGAIMSFLSPVALVPVIGLIGLSLFEAAAEKAAVNWGIAALTVFLMVLFSQFLNTTCVPIPSYSKSRNGFYIWRFPIFKLFPVLLTLIITWLFSYILTVSNVFAENSEARTDTYLSIIEDSNWFYYPYPFMFGMPTVSVAGVLAMISGVIASSLESIGDYYACAKLSGAPPPPKHAISRGLGMEGLGSIFSALSGSCTASTSISQNIGAIWITKVGSRRVVQACGLVMMLVGLLGKLCGVFMTIPTPIIGGLFIVLFSLIFSVALSNLQLVDLESSRNLFVLGLSFFLGLSLPSWMKNNTESVQTSFQVLDQVIVVLCSTPMFVGGLIAILLDNTIPGTLEERGLTKWNISTRTVPENDEKGVQGLSSIYDLPFGMDLIRRWNWCSKCPSSPTFDSFSSDVSKTNSTHL